MTTLTPQIAEIVTFTLHPDADMDAYLALTNESGEFTRKAPGFVSRQVSRGEDGTWTDLVVWDSMENAKAAQAAFMEQDFAPKLIAGIDKDSFAMRHQPILWQQS